MSDPLASRQRPPAWTVFGIIDIVIGAFGVLGGLGSMAMLSLQPPEGVENPVLKLLSDSAVYRAYYWISTPLGIAAGAMLIAAGIGLLRTRAWGRSLSLAYAWYALVAALVGFGFTWVLVIKPLLAQLDAANTGVERAAMIGGAVGGVIGGVFSLTYPALLVFLRKDARAGMPGDGEQGNPYEAPGTSADSR